MRNRDWQLRTLVSRHRQPLSGHACQQHVCMNVRQPVGPDQDPHHASCFQLDFRSSRMGLYSALHPGPGSAPSQLTNQIPSFKPPPQVNRIDCVYARASLRGSCSDRCSLHLAHAAFIQARPVAKEPADACITTWHQCRACRLSNRGSLVGLSKTRPIVMAAAGSCVLSASVSTYQEALQTCVLTKRADMASLRRGGTLIPFCCRDTLTPPFQTSHETWPPLHRIFS